MKKIDPEEYQKRLDRITEMFSEMVGQADELSQHRCPYKDRNDRCTAAFGCRNQRKPPNEGGLLVCASDDKLNYRSAWDTEPRPGKAEDPTP